MLVPSRFEFNNYNNLLNISKEFVFGNSLLPYLTIKFLSTYKKVYPEGIRKLINWVSKNYKNVPIIITENGMSDNGQLEDYERVTYINEYIDQTLMALYEDGCNVQGYFAWTLVDDFEWKYGYTIKFGLYYVDYLSPQKSRIPKLSAYNFREIARTRRVNFDFIINPKA